MKGSLVNPKLKTGLLLGFFFTGLLLQDHLHAQALTSGADFLKIDSGARSEGMGGAFTAVADDVDTLTYNPAGLALLKQPELGYLHMLYLADIGYNFGGAALPLPAGEDTFGLGLGLVNLGTPTFDSTYGLAPAVSAGDNAILLALAYRVKDVLAFGATGKYILRNLATYSANALGGDAGVLFTPGPHFRAGLVLLNVGQSVQFISEADPLPTIVRLGLAYQILDVPHHSLLVSADNGYELGSSSYVGAAGAEYWYDKTLALRVGYTGDAFEQHFTAGAGINVDPVEFDYAYAPMGTLGDTHRFSLIVRFGAGGAAGLSAPSDFAASPLDGGVRLSWKAVVSPSVLGYNLYVKKPGMADFSLVTHRPLKAGETTVKLNHLLNGQNYSFGIASVSEGGRVSSMTQISALPGAAASAAAGGLLAPSGLKATPSGNGVELTWDKSASPNVEGYNLYLADDQGKPGKKLSAAKPIMDNRINLKNLNPARQYHFMVTAVSPDGAESPATPSLTVSLQDLQKSSVAALLAPAHLTLRPQDGKVHLGWDPVSGAVKYNIYVSHDGGTSFKLLTPKGYEKNEVTMGGMKPGQSYLFGVSSLAADGRESDKALQVMPQP